jgi:calcineurin-like phosphoesterase family protein
MEPSIYFTSDTHFGHTNILKYSRRPFADVQAMDEALIANWNAVVGPEDVIYHLGDFTLAGEEVARRILFRLQGQIRVLGYPWHHDHRWLPAELGPSDLYSASGHPVEILKPMEVLTLPVADRQQVIVLCHYPLARWDRAHYGSWHLHGHSHGTYFAPGAILDVGVDCHHYAPVSLQALAKRLPAPEKARKRVAED